MSGRASFKERLRASEPVYGLFSCSYSVQVAEALTASGTDFLLFDGEHTPNSWPHLHVQLCAIARSPVASLVRLPGMDAAAVKMLLDMGVDGLMLPNVQTASEATQLVAMTRYPPHGTRGVAGTVRATNYGRDRGYLTRATEAFSLIVQLESVSGVHAARTIASVDGIDAVFLGPNDLAADMGLLGQPDHVDVRASVIAAIQEVRAAGKAVGILCAEPDIARYREAGASVFALGSDLGLLVRAADGLMQRCRQAAC